MKPAIKSQTIVNAVAGYLVLIAPLIYGAYQDERFLNEVELTAVLGGAYTLKQTIEGRLKATEKIGKPSETENFSFESNWEQNPINRPLTDAELLEMSSLTPDFSYVETLPSAEDVDLVEPESTEAIDYEENGELDVNLDTSGSYKVRAVRDTVIKKSFQDSSDLDESEHMSIEKGKEFNIEAYKFVGKTNHIEARIEGETYFLFVPHIELFNDLGKEVNLVDNSSPVLVVNPKKTAFKLPGFTSTFYLEDSVIPGGNFTWSEVTHGGKRIPTTKQQVDNAIALCKHLQGLRNYLGNVPMRVTSFGRPEPINSQVGGAKNSYHTKYAACDFYVPGANMVSIQEKVKNYWISNKLGGVGLAASAGKGFVHLDLGPVRTFPY